MSKRKRLSPARPDFLAAAPVAEPVSARAPIAQVASDAAATSALQEVSDALTAARAEGRMVLSLPLDAVEVDHLERDRVLAQDEAMAALKASLRARGQQTPVEVQALAGGRYGLISGWRRLLALRALHAETGASDFATVQALVRSPASQADAYVAMVEENEIRADLSYYERARIVRRSVETGVFETEKAALQSLFAQASYARRSKIKSFLLLVDELGGVLRFPAHVPERTGLAFARLVKKDAAAGRRIARALEQAERDTPEAEARVMAAALAAERQGQSGAAAQPASADGQGAAADGTGDGTDMPESWRIATGVRFSARKGRVELTGEGVNAGFIERLRTWLHDQP